MRGRGIDRREVRAVGLGIAIVCGYTLCVLASAPVDLADFGQLLLTYLKLSMALWLSIGVFAGLSLLYVRRALGSEPASGPIVVIAQWLIDRWRRDRLLSLVWPPILFALLMASFNAFKQVVLVDAGFRFDALFTSADRLLFLGQDPWRVTHALLGGVWPSYLIDRLYHGWFVPMSLGVIACAFPAGGAFRLRTQYLLSYLGVWILIGTLFAWALPAMGPCFTGVFLQGSDPFADLIETLADLDRAIAATMPGERLGALHTQHWLARLHGTEELTVGAGISAMPSVHNALAVLFALAARRVSRTLGRAMAAYAVIIWIGSIHLGWHYAWDGIIAGLITLAIWRAAGGAVTWLERHERAGPRRLPTSNVAVG